MKEKIERKLNLASDGSAGVDDENSRLKDNRSQIENVTIESKDLLSKPIIESEEFVSILGVKLPKGLGGNVRWSP